MQKLTLVLLFGLLALATATPKFKKLTPINPEPLCSLTEITLCAGEIGGKILLTAAEVHFMYMLKKRPNKKNVALNQKL